MRSSNFLLIIVVLCAISSLTLVASQGEDIRFYGEFGTNITVYEKCRVDGFICDSSYECNLSIIDPNQNLIIDGQLMLGVGVYRNFSLNLTQTQPNGVYEATVDCTNSTESGSDTFFYQITPDGSKPIDVGQGLILTGAIFILLIIALSIGFLGFKSTNTTVMLSLLSFSVLLMVFSLGFVLNIIELSFGTFSGIINNYSSAFVLFVVLVSVGAIGLILYIIYVALNYYWGLRGMKDTLSIGVDG